MQEIGDELAQSLEKTPEEYRPKTIKINVPLSYFGLNVKQGYFPEFKEKIPLWIVLFLGSVITIMTLIWGTL